MKYKKQPAHLQSNEVNWA